MKIGEAIREKREMLGLKQRELAAAVGVDSSHICKIETGDIAAPNFDLLARICVHLQLSIDEIIAGVAAAS